MISGVLGITGILSSVTILRGNTYAWHKNILPTSIPGVRNNIITFIKILFN